MNRVIAVADIGGTNARFATAELDGTSVRSVGQPITLRTSNYPTFADAWRTFAATLDGGAPDSLGLSFAGPVDARRIRLTNNHWTIDPDELRKMGIVHFKIVNDFAAVAYALEQLGDVHLRFLCGPDGPLPGDAIITLLGPGTGLGVAQIVRGEVVETEGGHAGFAPADEVEERILELVRKRLGRVEIEHIVSGPGLANIHLALTGEDREDETLWKQVLAGDTLAAFDRWCAILGGFAGDLALVQGADAVVVAGGLGYRLREKLAATPFQDRFVAKGRFEARMRSIRVRILDHPQPGLLGAAVAFAHG
ncbi:glucokinase [Sphingomonas sp. HDW15A]|uniref:glucokinase n=1 Tax=Sphingomonas sp. HDW15A TaxID=2714942 RepID=UPI00140C5F0D|nr:glucokinase [Sphingomonas sp. HDW15A]QIK96751.1 glucokinase [Sphingomonas sp. HDW15A]